MKRNMRLHMVAKHGMSRQEVDRITNKRKTAGEFLAQYSGGLVPKASVMSADSAETGGPSRAVFAPSDNQSRSDVA